MKTHFAYKPKIQPLPRTLILASKTYEQDFYKMLTTKDPRVVGIMYAFPNEIDKRNFYHVGLLYIKEQRQGFGTEFIDFAKNRSKQLGCEGRVFLQAESEVMGAQKPPHIFYRKQGFTTNDKKYLKVIDEFIKENKEMENKDSKSIYMYYDPNNYTFGQKLLNWFFRFFDI
jgi:GNAT superfamily N-acetyltransferase